MSPPLFVRLADDLEECAGHLDRGCELERKPEHLDDWIEDTVGRACRLVLEALEAGAPLLGEIPPLLEREDALARVCYWFMFVVPSMRSQCPERFADRAGEADYVGPQSDPEGQVLDADRRPLPDEEASRDRQWREATRRWIEAGCQGPAPPPYQAPPVALETDDYDPDDWMARLRRQARDSAAACRAAAGLLRAGLPAPPPFEAGPVALVPGGYTLRGGTHRLTGRPLALLRALLDAPG